MNDPYSFAWFGALHTTKAGSYFRTIFGDYGIAAATVLLPIVIPLLFKAWTARHGMPSFGG